MSEGFDASTVSFVRALPTASLAVVAAVSGYVLMRPSPDRAPIPRPEELGIATKRMSEEAMRPGLDRTCYGAQLDQRPHGRRIARATLFIGVLDADGKVVRGGTGTVVAGSGGTASDARVLTARHVVDDAETIPGARIALVSSSGRIIGTASVVPGARGDLAVLSPRNFEVGGREDYAAIEGLEIALASDETKLSGFVGLPAGLDHGASGAAVVDSDGRIRGVLSKSSAGGGTEAVPFEAGDVMAMTGGDGTFRSATRTFPGLTSYTAEGVGPTVGALLGRVGAVPSTRSEDDAFPATIAGYPQLSCVAYEAVALAREEPMEASLQAAPRI